MSRNALHILTSTCPVRSVIFLSRILCAPRRTPTLPPPPPPSATYTCVFPSPPLHCTTASLPRPLASSSRAWWDRSSSCNTCTCGTCAVVWSTSCEACFDVAMQRADWESLPDGLLLRVLSKACEEEGATSRADPLRAAAQVCRRWRAMAAAIRLEDTARSRPKRARGTTCGADELLPCSCSAPGGVESTCRGTWRDVASDGGEAHSTASRPQAAPRARATDVCEAGTQAAAPKGSQCGEASTAAATWRESEDEGEEGVQVQSSPIAMPRAARMDVVLERARARAQEQMEREDGRMRTLLALLRRPPDG